MEWINTNNEAIESLRTYWHIASNPRQLIVDEDKIERFLKAIDMAIFALIEQVLLTIGELARLIFWLFLKCFGKKTPDEEKEI